MRYLTILIPALLTSACATPQIEYRPLYLEAQPDKPAPPDLKPVLVEFTADPPLFVLTPEAFDTLNENLKKTGKYIELLIEGWDYYERSTSEPPTN